MDYQTTYLVCKQIGEEVIYLNSSNNRAEAECMIAECILEDSKPCYFIEQLTV